MKILFPIGSFYPAQTGGPNNSVKALAEALGKLGQEVFVITTDFGLETHHSVSKGKWVQEEGYQVYYSERIPLSTSISPRIHKLLNEVKPDLICLTSIFTGLSQVVARWARKSNVPYIWSPRGELAPQALNYKKTFKKYYLSIPPVKQNLGHAIFHCTSLQEEQDVKAFFQSSYKTTLGTDDIINLPNIASEVIFKHSDDTLPQGGEPYVLFLGRIAPIKNLESLIRGFALMSDGRDIKLIIAGPVEDNKRYVATLKELVGKLNLSNKVVFTNKRVEGADKQKLLREASLLAITSMSENFSMAVLEALALGVPALTSTGMPWKVLEQEHAGYWIENDQESIGETLSSFFALDEMQRLEMSAKALAVAERYRAKNLAPQYLKAFQQAQQTS